MKVNADGLADSLDGEATVRFTVMVVVVPAICEMLTVNVPVAVLPAVKFVPLKLAVTVRVRGVVLKTFWSPFGETLSHVTEGAPMATLVELFALTCTSPLPVPPAGTVRLSVVVS